MNNPYEAFNQRLKDSIRLHVQQKHELVEIFLEWETKNKYQIFDENMNQIGFAAEQSKGIFAIIARMFLGHWRPFEIVIFNEHRERMYKLKFPFRWLWKTLYISDANGMKVGYLQQRFSILGKKFDLMDQHNQVVARINSPLYRIWTFEFKFRGKKLGSVSKKWSGLLSEMFTDKDNFVVEFDERVTDVNLRALMLGTSFMVDIVYFEKKSR